MNDFRHIKDWTVADHVSEHKNDVKWLTDEITSIRKTEAGPERKIIVITHHAPSTKGTSAPMHDNNPWSSAFGTDLLETKEGSCLDDVQWWIFGHTHYSCESIRGSVRLLSNQRGYVFPTIERVRPGFHAKFRVQMRQLYGHRSTSRDEFDAGKVIEV